MLSRKNPKIVTWTVIEKLESYNWIGYKFKDHNGNQRTLLTRHLNTNVGDKLSVIEKGRLLKRYQIETDEENNYVPKYPRS